MELATSSDISATAYMVNSQPPHKCIAYDSEIASYGSERKTYFPIFIADRRVLACVDQGSDLNLIQKTLFEKLFPLRVYEIRNKDQGNIKTFSNHPVRILGSFSCLVKVNKYGSPFITIFTIIEDLKNGIPTLLFGNRGLADGWAMFAFTGCIEDPCPELIFKNPVIQQVNVSYVAPRDLYTVSGEYNIGPFESKRIKLYLHPAAQVLCKDVILITSHLYDQVHILPSRSDLHFDEKRNCYTAYAALINTKRQPSSGIVTGRFEILEDHLAVAIHPGTKQQLKRLCKKYPIAQEILPTESSWEPDLPLIQVNQVTLNEDQCIKLDNGEILNKDEILAINKESYTGTAEISSSTLDVGLEAPTIIYNSA